MSQGEAVCVHCGRRLGPMTRACCDSPSGVCVPASPAESGAVFDCESAPVQQLIKSTRESLSQPTAREKLLEARVETLERLLDSMVTQGRDVDHAFSDGLLDEARAALKGEQA